MCKNSVLIHILWDRDKFLCMTKTEPPIYYLPKKPLEEDSKLAEQQKEKAPNLNIFSVRIQKQGQQDCNFVPELRGVLRQGDPGAVTLRRPIVFPGLLDFPGPAPFLSSQMNYDRMVLYFG